MNRKKKIKRYVIDDPNYGKFEIRYSDNPWWKDREKVVKIITGYKMDCKPAELRILAGISKDQLDYFLEQHPELSAVFDDFRKIPVLKARATIVKAVMHDVSAAFKYLERKEPDEFKEKKEFEFNDNKPILIQDVL